MWRFIWLLSILVLPLWAQNKPNILFILVDDMGWGDLGCFYQNDKAGDKHHQTPHLDSLAAAGVQFRQHYCGAPVCAPSRASLLLGQHQGHANVRNNQFDKALAANHTLGNMLQKAGYTTALIGKYGLQGVGERFEQWTAYPTKRGFDYFYGMVRHVDGHQHYPGDEYPAGDTPIHRDKKEIWENESLVTADLSGCYTTDLFTARAKKWIATQHQVAPEKPFFMLLCYDTPHAALQLPTQAYPQGGGSAGGVQWLGTSGAMINTANSAEIDTYRHPDYTGKGWSDIEERFATSVRRIDDCVGDLQALLMDLEIAENTLVVFASDNGPHNESYLTGKAYAPTSFRSYGPFDGIKRDAWEGGIRVPLIVSWPGRATSGKIVSEPSQFQDWMATLADVAGVPRPARTDGVSLLPTIEGGGAQEPSQIYIEYYNNTATPNYNDFDSSHRARTRNQMQVVFEAGLKGVRYNIQSHADNFEIYDIANDPQELNNLAASHPEVQATMKAKVLQMRTVDADAKRPYDQALVPAVGATGAAGLKYACYEGQWPWLPAFELLEPVQQGEVSLPDVGAPQRTRETAVGLCFTGFIEIPSSGEYIFYLESAGRSMLWLHAAVVIDNDYNFTDKEQSGKIRLARGLHPIKLAYAQAAAPHSLTLSYASALIPKQVVPATAFRREASGTVTVNDYIWGGAGSVDNPVFWNNTSVNNDPAYWGYPTAPELNEGLVHIPAGGIKRDPALSLSGTATLLQTGGYLYIAQGVEVNGANALYHLSGGHLNAQNVKSTYAGNFRVAGGLMEFRGADKPLVAGTQGYLDFVGTHGVLRLPNKDSAYLQSQIQAGVIRIDGQQVAGVGPEHAVNGRYFNNTVGKSLVLVQKGSYAEQVLAGNPSCYLMFEERSGASHAVDSSGFVKHFTEGSGALFGYPGLIGTAAYFYGSAYLKSNQLVYDLTIQDSFTIEMVAYIESITNEPQVLLAQSDKEGSGRSILVIDANGELNSFLSGQSVTSNFFLEPKRWHHLVLLIAQQATEQALTFYVNGQQAAAQHLVKIESCKGGWVLGSHKSLTQQFFYGALNSFVVYKRLLSEAEIKARFQLTSLNRNKGLRITIS